MTGLPYLGSTSINGGQLGNAYADFLLGLATSASVQTPQDPQYRKTSWSLFVQDAMESDPEADSHLWDTLGSAEHWQEIQDRIAGVFTHDSQSVCGGPARRHHLGGYGAGRCNCEFTSAYPYAIQPRLGVAYQIDSKTVFRAGWGLTYGTTADSNYISTLPDYWRRLYRVQRDLVCIARLRTACRYLRPGFAIYPGAIVSDYSKRRNRSVPRATQ